MIIPPSLTPSFYSVLLASESGTKFLQSLGVEADNIESVIITSLDFDSDMRAIAECTNSLTAIGNLVQEEGAVCKTSLNPLYLPGKHDLDSTFDNHLIVANLKLESANELATAAVCFKPFELPDDSEILLS